MFYRLFHYLHIHYELWYHSWPLNTCWCWQIIHNQLKHPKYKKGGYSQLSVHPTTLNHHHLKVPNFTNWWRLRNTSRQIFSSTIRWYRRSPFPSAPNSLTQPWEVLGALHSGRGELEPWAVSISCSSKVLNAHVMLSLLCHLPQSHDTHLLKYHLVIPSMWLLSPCLILMEKDKCSNVKKGKS